jgi:ABC-type sugar transport system permease subunit
LLNDKLFNLIQLNKFNLNRRQRSLFLILFLAPCVIYVFAFRIFPLLYSVYLSFNSLNILQSEVASYVGFQNYTNLRRRLVETVGNSIEELSKLWGSFLF